ncbi:MAG: adenylate/guanylate cyclase domain-containing protein [Deltaproteobacteria bacterium]|nr:adenylate/guanylate cyclase domain-containing protein [Deltaproteobacteria bacterium]
MSREGIQWSASEGRLQRLIAERLQPGADKARIDERIWDLFGETWAIMFTDLAGFSRRVERFGIVHFLQTIFESERLLLPIVEAHDGVVLKREGDSMLIIFRRASAALSCAIAMQRSLVVYNRDKPAEEDILLCLGLGCGRVLKLGDADVFGAEVNAASKLGEDTAKAHEILVTESFRDAVAPDLAGGDAELEFLRLDYVPPGATAAFKLDYVLEP